MSEIAFRDEPMDFDAIEIEPEPAPPPPEPPKAVAPPPPGDGGQTALPGDDATVGHAFNLLASTVLTHNARTLEDLVQDMLRPMLKAWLDDNLPVMVERSGPGRDRARRERALIGGRRSGAVGHPSRTWCGSH